MINLIRQRVFSEMRTLGGMLLLLVFLFTWCLWVFHNNWCMAARDYAYGTEVIYHLDEQLQFPDFAVTFQGERSEPVDIAPGKFVYFDFKISNGDLQEKVSWTPGTGALSPVKFIFNGQTYLLNHGFIHTLGPPMVNTVTVWPANNFTYGIGGVIRTSKSGDFPSVTRAEPLTVQEIDRIRAKRANGAERKVIENIERYQIKEPKGFATFWVPLSWEGRRIDISHSYPREMWQISSDQLTTGPRMFALTDTQGVEVEISKVASSIPKKSIRQNHPAFFWFPELSSFSRDQANVCIAGRSVPVVYKTTPSTMGLDSGYHSFAADLYLEDIVVLAEGRVSKKEYLTQALSVVCNMNLTEIGGQ